MVKILRNTQPEKVGRELLIKEETIPVHFAGKTIAIISRHRNADLMRSPSKSSSSITAEIARKIYQMVTEGNFPIRNSIYSSRSQAPRGR
jgi:hypothetical protein